MIGDLTSAPEPVAIKLFSQDPALLQAVGAAGRRGDQEDPRRGRRARRHREHDQRPGDACSRSIQAMAARAGFTPQEIELDASAILQGEPAPTPVVLNDRAYTIRVRFPESTRASVDAIKNTLLVSATGQDRRRSARWPRSKRFPGQTEIRRENLQRNVTVTARLEGVDLGAGMAAVQRAIADLHLPPAIRVAVRRRLRGAAAVVPRPAARAGAGGRAGVHRAAVRVRRFRRADRGASRRRCCRPSACSWRCWSRGTTFNLSSFMGLIMVIGIVAKNGILLLDADQRFRAEGMSPEDSMIQRGRAPAAADHDDGAGHRGRA